LFAACTLLSAVTSKNSGLLKEVKPSRRVLSANKALSQENLVSLIQSSFSQKTPNA
jgi:hypothetical protein